MQTAQSSCAGTCSAAPSAGPIVKNKLFFFFDYQGQRFDHPSTTKQLGLFTAARA